ncbi:hypothetical protein [Methylobacterium fujisawaense]|jgi:hypothetical protein
MSRLLELVGQLKGIPAKEMHADKVGGLTRLCEAVEKGAAELATQAATARYATAVVGREDFGAVAAAAAKVTPPTARLRKALGRSPGEVTPARADELMVRIGDQVSAGRKALRDRWKAFADATSRDYGALAKAGRDARLRGAEGLEEALRAFGTAAANAPANAAAARRVRERRDALRTSVRDLGLEDEVGAFMVAAAEGRADPRDLYNPAVKGFLDARPEVWRLLRVTL